MSTGDGLLELRTRLIEARELLALVVGAEERVDQAVAGDRLQSSIAELMLARSAHVFMREVDARDAGIVGCKHDRHAGGKISGQRVVLAAHAEDEIAAGEADLDCDRLTAHCENEAADIMLESQRGAVADAARARDCHRIREVKGQILRRHQTKPQLAGMQRNRYILGKKLDDLHVGAVVVARDLMVLRTDKIERYDPWLGANERGRGRGLDKDFLDR